MALTIGVTWLIVSRIGVTLDEATSLEGIESAPSFATLGISSGLLLAALALSALLWGRMAGELAGRTPGHLASIRIVLTANLGRYLPGRIWPIAVLGLLSRRVGIPSTVAAMAGVLGQSFSLAAAGILGAPVLLGAGGQTGIAGRLLLAALALGVLTVSVPPLMRAGLGVVFRLARIDRNPLPDTSAWFGTRWLVLYLVNWGIYGSAFVLFLRSFGFVGDVLPLMSAFAGAYVLGYLAVFAPAGLGVREGFLILFLRPEFGAAAVGIAILTRIWMTVVEVLPAGVLAVHEVYRGTDREEDDASG